MSAAAALLGLHPESFPDGTAPPSVKARAVGRPKQDILLFCVYEGRPSLCARPVPQKNAGHPAAVPGAAGLSLRLNLNTNGIKIYKESKMERGGERTRNGKKAETGRSRSRYPLNLPPQDGGAGGAGARAPSRGMPPAGRFCGTSLTFFAEKQDTATAAQKEKPVHPAMPGLSLQKFSSRLGRFAQSGSRTGNRGQTRFAGR